ncbi:Fic family protein [bacterium]|nr:Fic family protein [bacterium]
MKILNRIKEKREKLEALRPLPKSALRRLRDEMSLELTHNSSAIEGNTLTLNETRLVIREGLTVGGKPLKDHLEVKNHEEAFQYTEALSSKNQKIKTKDILELHAMVMKDIDLEFGGIFRSGRVRIAGADFIPPNPQKVPDLVREWIEQVNRADGQLTTISALHHRFVWIHPFFDGNGRTGRLLLNLSLMKSGYPPAIILVRDRMKYYRALKEADTGENDRLNLLVAQAVERSLDLYLDATGEIDEELLPLSEIAPKTRYSAEYLSLLARKGELSAQKVGRNWHSTYEAVQRYIAHRKRVR